MKNQEAALLSDGYFAALPGTIQRVEVDGRAVYQAAGAQPVKGEGYRDARAVVVLSLTSPPPQHYAEIALIQEAFRPTDPQEGEAEVPRCYQLVSDHLDSTLADLVFWRFKTTSYPLEDETVCELWFSDYSLVGGRDDSVSSL